MEVISNLQSRNFWEKNEIIEKNWKLCLLLCFILTLKSPITTEADDTHKYIFIFSGESKTIFHMNPLPSSRGFTWNIKPYFLQKIKVKKFWVSSAAIFLWKLKNYSTFLQRAEYALYSVEWGGGKNYLYEYCLPFTTIMGMNELNSLLSSTVQSNISLIHRFI